jgi:hypothetical protein
MTIDVATLLVAETRMAEISLQYREQVAAGATSQWWYLLIPVAAIAIASVIYHFVNRPRPVVHAPEAVFDELCKAHRINGSARSLLESIAEHSRLAHPAALFVSESQFELALDHAQSHLALDRRRQMALARLRQRLFSCDAASRGEAGLGG